MNRRIRTLLAVILLTAASCGINSVSRSQLEKVKPGDILVYRYQKDGKSWFYADKITRIDGEKIYFNPSRKEATAGNDERLKDFDADRELSITRVDLLRYQSEQGDDRKVIIWIL